MSKKKKPDRLGPLAVLGVVRELRRGAGTERPLVVDGARELVPVLARALREGGDPAAVREGGDPAAGAVLVWVGKPDEERLRAASLAHVPIVGVTEGGSLPYVLDTEIVRVVPGRGFPVEEIGAAVARSLGEGGTALAARLPALREPLVDELIRAFAWRNGLIGGAVRRSTVDMPALTLNQVRLVLRIALAYGRQLDNALLPEVLAVVGAGFGLRRLARGLVARLPLPLAATRGAVAWGGTRAVGEAARRRFALARG